MAITFHLDEHIQPALANALRHRGIDVTPTTDADLVGAEDREHLAYATNAGRVLVTQDVDFLGCTRELYGTQASRTGAHEHAALETHCAVWS